MSDFMKTIHDNIINHRNTSEFKKMALVILAHKSSSSDIMKLKQAFDQYDSTTDGTITFEEFEDSLSNFLFSTEEIKSIFQSIVSWVYVFVVCTHRAT